MGWITTGRIVTMMTKKFIRRKLLIIKTINFPVNKTLKPFIIICSITMSSFSPSILPTSRRFIKSYFFKYLFYFCLVRSTSMFIMSRTEFEPSIRRFITKRHFAINHFTFHSLLYP